MVLDSNMKALFSALPDDRPLTALCIVEDMNKCPPGYTIVSKTYDQDTDADLWKDTFWGGHGKRYLCLSKSDGAPDYVIESVNLQGDKDIPPSGFTVINETRDTGQKPMRKKQFCFKAVHRNSAAQAITDIIMLSRSRRAPEGFRVIGEVENLVLCAKTGSIRKFQTNGPSQISANTPLPYQLYPGLPNGQSSPGVQQLPRRAAPPVPPPVADSRIPVPASYQTLGTVSSLDGVPFQVNPLYKSGDDARRFVFPGFQSKTKEDIEREYQYNFRTELEASQRID